MNMKNSNGNLMVHTCEFCDRSFRSEKTLTSHSCRLKQREQSKNQPSVKLAFIAYQRFYILGQGGVQKSWEQFRESPYYAGFVRFATHMRAINAVNPLLIIDWLIKNQIKLDQWDSDAVYGKYLEEILYIEPVESAVERSFNTMQDWGDQFNMSFNQYLYHAAPNRMVHDLSSGQLSPWVLYATSSGQDALSKFNEEQLNFVIKYIEPAKWSERLLKNSLDLDYVRMACREAGIL